MLNIKPLIYILGIFLSILTVFMFIPMVFSVYYAEETIADFIISSIITGSAAILLIQSSDTKAVELNIRDMFFLTSMTWFVISLFAALPFTFYHGISYTDAFFETMSGVTTTGSTVLSGLDTTDHSILIWRSLLQWFGGIGFIVMAVAVLPFLNVGGMRLFRTESSDWSDKSTPRTQHLAKYLFQVYVMLTLLCILAYNLAGMSWFEAINHAMTTLSTGGFSTSDASMAHFSPAAHWVGIIFMLAGGLPLLMFVQSIRLRDMSIWNDQQVKGFLLFVTLVSVTLAIWLSIHKTIPFMDALRLSSFNVISVVTTTGFGLTDYQAWGAVSGIVFLFLMLVGGCSGSTAGGIKIFRFQIAFAVMRQQLKQQFHPHASFTETYNSHRIRDDIVRSMVTFFILIFLTIISLSILLVLCGLDPVTGFTGAITAVANVGPGLGPIIGPAGNFSSLPDAAKWLLSIGMLLGRLEILTIAVLFHPQFWRY
ncbi:TrkH family potassium uptake protein [Shewanella intestini]|uniref:Trk system potassium uptake protein n=1 Tax=Shewanella intestini TaxID=2017544 RepID=A0ABS5I4A1_9GAMM|nr:MULTISPECIES: TrkH family potassium uptake protein [Shewanella]MBR9728844.1 TrkH family potassium uptake protein [Shewanella intestini]MRG37090.1 potassium transporter TrkH [Shewanella sp. XMDDZSB0408]